MYLDSTYYPSLLIHDNLDFTLWPLNVEYYRSSIGQKNENIVYDVSMYCLY